MIAVLVLAIDIDGGSPPDWLGNSTGKSKWLLRFESDLGRESESLRGRANYTGGFYCHGAHANRRLAPGQSRVVLLLELQARQAPGWMIRRLF
eukprot:COSAG02_NODE_16031_length_1119_cov_2.057843_3_plen_93_part_00